MSKIFSKLLSVLFVIGLVLAPLKSASAEGETLTRYRFSLESSDTNIIFTVPEGFSIKDKVGDEMKYKYSYASFADADEREIEIQVSEYPDKDKQSTGIMCYELDSDLYSDFQNPVITKDPNGTAGISYWSGNDFYKHRYHSDGYDCIKMTFVNNVNTDQLNILKWVDIQDKHQRFLGDFINLAKRADDYYKVKSAEILLYEKALKMDATLPVLTDNERYTAISELADFYYNMPYESFYFYDIAPTFENSWKLEEMKDFYWSYIRKYPNNARLYYDLSCTYAGLGNKRMALFNLRKALQIDPYVLSKYTKRNDTMSAYWGDPDFENILKSIPYKIVSEPNDEGAVVAMNFKGDYLHIHKDTLIPLYNKKFNYVLNFSYGLALVSTGWRGEDIYFINEKGENAFNEIYKGATSFKDGYAFVRLKNDEVMTINKEGKRIESPGSASWSDKEFINF